MAWYALMTVPQREFDAVAVMADFGFEAFTPTEQKHLKRYKGQRGNRVKSYPMIRGYCFAWFDRIPWHILRDERETIRGVVSSGITPTPIPDDQIAAVRQLSTVVVPYRNAVDTHRALRSGQVVEIVSGPFAGHVTRLEHITLGKAMALIDMLGKAHPVEFDLDMLEAV
jgi:transcription antitermination factor NusG